MRQAGEEAQAQRGEAGKRVTGQEAERLFIFSHTTHHSSLEKTARKVHEVQTEAYSVQFDDGVHLSDAAVSVHVDDDVTCGAREGAGGNAG